MNESLGAITLKCTGCGASLDITPDLDVFSCGYCGARQLVRRSGGTVSLKPVEEAISRVQQGTDRTAAELAVRRLREDLAAIDRKIQQARADFSNQGVGSGTRLAFTVMTGMGISVLFIMFQYFILGIVTFIAICVALALSWKLIARARARFTALEGPLTAKRNYIDVDLQRYLALLNNQSA